MRIRGIILAAGLSKRMGRNKLSMILNEKTILDTVIANTEGSLLDEIVLIYGRYEIDTKIRKIYNPSYEKGMSTSLIAGISDFCGDAVMVLLGDMPFVTTDIINNLYERFALSAKSIAVPVKDGRRGNPVVIGKKYYSCLLEGRGDKGARDIITNNKQDVEYVETDNDGIFIDIDDMERYNDITLNKLYF